ncbi:hypothetical protein NQ317_008110 [Molorchus minor]|uniref:LysM domain-containing protein n=1 Tax=Molorchus minor TaxID=1323400 RepID=A0ABQ9JDY0_9CUCU|nr:hypothetical protein NQ317_008110 [Molorchus minor]
MEDGDTLQSLAVRYHCTVQIPVLNNIRLKETKQYPQRK